MYSHVAQQKHCHAVPFSLVALAGVSRLPLCEMRKQHNRLHRHWNYAQDTVNGYHIAFVRFLHILTLSPLTGSASGIQWKTTPTKYFVRACKVVNQIQLISVTAFMQRRTMENGLQEIFRFFNFIYFLCEILTPGVMVQTDLKLIFGSIAYLKRDKKAHNLINIFRQKWVRHWFNGMD